MVVSDQATHAAEDDLRKELQEMKRMQLQLTRKIEFMLEQTFEHFKKHVEKSSDKFDDMERNIKGMKESMISLQKYQDDLGKNLKSDMEDLRQDVDQIKTQRKDIVDSISKRQDVFEEHIKDQGEQIKVQGEQIKVQREHIKDQGEQIKDQGGQIKVQREHIKDQGEQIKVQREHIKDQGEQIKDQLEQIKVQREHIKDQGEQIKDNKTQIKDNKTQIRWMKSLFGPAFPQYDATLNPHCVDTLSDQMLMDANKTPDRKKDTDHGIPFSSPFVSTSTPISTLGRSQQDESGYCGTPQGDSSINGGRIK